MKRQIAFLAVLALVAVASRGAVATRKLTGAEETVAEKSGARAYPPFLYVWGGAVNASLAKDSMFVVNLRKAKFGNVTMYQTPYNGLEPHHCGVSSNNKYLGAGGLLAVLSGLPNVHFWDLTKPAVPKYISKVDQPKSSSITDDFLPTPDGGFLVTMMGSASGGSPGRLVKYDKDLKLVAENPMTDAGLLGYPGFNPHGVAIDPVGGYMITTDFIDPSTTLASVPGGVTHRGTVRIWDYKTLMPVAVIDAGNVNDGNIGACHIGTSGNFYWVGGSKLFWVDPSDPEGSWMEVQDFKMPLHFILSFAKGTRALMGSFQNSTLILLDTTEQDDPVVLDTAFLGAGAGGHFGAISPDETLVAATTYFLEEGAAGKVHAAGDRTLRFFMLNSDKTKLTPHPTVPCLDFKTLFPKYGMFNPHGVAFLNPVN